MRSQVGSLPEQYSNLDWGIQVDAGTGNLSPQTPNFYIQGFNRVGRNLLSLSKTQAIAQDDKLIITLGASLVLPGEDLWLIAIAAEITGDQNDAVQIATFNYKDLSDQVSINALPVDLEFTHDDQLKTDNLNVATFGDLAGIVTIEGMVRSVDDEGGKWYVFDGVNWVDYFLLDPLLYIGNTRNDGGSDRLSGNGVTEPALLIPPLVFDTNVTRVTTIPVRYWLLNDAPEGNGSNLFGKVNLRLSINGLTVSDDGKVWGRVFADLIKFELVGYYRLLDRSIDTGIDNVGVEQIWNPVSNLLEFPSNLLPGFLAVFDIFLDADVSDLSVAGYEAGDVLAIDFDYLGKVGQYMPALAALLGKNIAFADLAKLLVLPNRVLPGSALVGGFFFSSEQDEEGIFNQAVANTPNQTLVVNGATGGTYRLGAGTTIKSSEFIIAQFSTEAGFTNPGEFSDQLTLGGSSGIEVTVNHPVIGNNQYTIRIDYPDGKIAGNNNADWDNPLYRVYLKFNGITLYEANSPIVSASAATEQIQINDLSNYTDVTSNPPLDSVASFGRDYALISSAKVDVAEIGGGVLPAGVWEVAIRYEWSITNQRITKLRQDIDGTTLKRLNSTFEEILSSSKLWQDDILTLEQARALDFDRRTNRSVWKISDLGYVPYEIDLTLQGIDDGRNIIRFNSGAGGMRPQYTMLQIGTASELLAAYSLLRIGTGLIAEVDIIGASLSLRLDEGVIALNNDLRSNLIDTGGTPLVDTAGNLLTT